MHARRLILVGTLAVAVAACQYLPGHSGEDGDAGPVSGPVAEGRALLEQGQLDAALEKLQQVPSDPESLYVQGLVWAAKAAQAPPPEPEEEGGKVPEFKLEERNALAFFETLTEARPEHARAHGAIAELLAPHMLAEEAASKHRRRSRGDEEEPDADDPDFSKERVLGEFKAAAQHDRSPESLERMVAFCASIADLDCADEGFRQLIERDAESAEPRIQYGDFLVEQDKLDEGIAQYDIALVWAPDDGVTRGKIADIYMTRGDGYARKREWAFAAQEYDRAADHVGDPTSERAKTLREKRAELVRLSGRR